MTQRGYDDLFCSSRDGGLRLEAVSADNGNALMRDGVEVEGRGFRAFQRNFRYRLVEVPSGRVRWERWQDERECSPVEAYVSDGGHVVVRAHFMDWASEDLLFFGPDGEKRLTVTVCRSGNPAPTQTGESVAWHDDHVLPGSAGPTWAWGSFETFPDVDGPHFSLRTAWGRRLVVDLREMKRVDAPEILRSPSIDRAERIEAMAVLEALVDGVVAGTATPRERSLVLGAVNVAAAHAVLEVEPWLRALEGIEPARTDWGRSCDALGGGWGRSSPQLRTLARIALRSIGREPSSEPGTLFEGTHGRRPEGPGLDIAARDASSAQCHPGGRGARAVRVGEDARSLLARLGAPDYVCERKVRTEKGYGRLEVWEYDDATSTTRITWEMPPRVKRGESPPPSAVAEVEVLEPAAWSRVDRTLELLLLRF